MILLHIGYHKTATTWFQKKLYPHINNSVLVGRDMIMDEIVNPWAYDFRPELARRKIQSVLNASESSEKALILCEEELTGNIHNGGQNGALTYLVAERLFATFPNAIVVLIVRNQISMMDSIYAQYIKMGGTWSPKQYFRVDRSSLYFRPNRNPVFDPKYLHYDEVVRHYQRLFGVQNTKIYCFEDFIENKISFINRFFCDTNLTPVTVDSHDSRSNPSYGRVLTEFVRFANHFTRDTLPNKHYIFHVPNAYRTIRHVASSITTALPHTPRTGVINSINPYDKKIFENGFRESNRKLKELVDLPLERHGYLL